MKKITYILLFALLSLLGMAQDTVRIDWGSAVAVTDWVQVNSGEVTSGGYTIITNSTSYGNSGVTIFDPPFPTGTGDYVYASGGDLITTIEGTFSSTVNVKVLIPKVIGTTHSVYINGALVGSTAAPDTITAYQVSVNDSIHIQVLAPGGNAYLGAVIITEASDPTYCETVVGDDSFSASAVITGTITGTSNGSIVQTITSPQSTTYLWNTTATSKDLTDITHGDYLVDITMVDSGCVITKNYTVPELSVCDTTDTYIVIDSVINIQKGEASNIGAVYIGVTGEAPPFTYSWSPGSETTQDITGLTEGWKIVTVTDNATCTATDSAMVIDYNNTTATFSSNFENGDYQPEIGQDLISLSSTGAMHVTANPDPDSRNSSAYVLRTATGEGTGARSEYTAQRITTNENHLFYTYKRYHPVGMFTDVTAGGVLVNQFKSYPCEAPPFAGVNPELEYLGDSICDGGGIFNDMQFNYATDELRYRSRSYPNCNSDYGIMSYGEWVDIIVEIYWTTSEQGYYRFWANDVLYGYSDNMRTLFGGFEDVEGMCDIFWSAGLYGSWSQSGGLSTDSLVAYIDDMAVYEADSGYTIENICPTCEVAPTVPTDTLTYKINVNASSEGQGGYNNYITTWAGDTAKLNFSNTFGQNKGYDVFLWDDASAASNNNLADDCFPEAVVQTSMAWQDPTTRHMLFRELDTSSTYNVRVHSATTNTGDNYGIQIWTDGNNDTVFADNNLCETAELANLSPDENGDLIINVQSINDVTPRPYINSFEIVEYANTDTNPCDTTTILITEDVIIPDTNNAGVGSISIDIVGGTTPYSYLWSNTETTQNITDLIADTYYVIVTDDNGCTGNDSFVVGNFSHGTWESGYEIVGSDTLLINSLTGRGNPEWVVTYCADQLANIDSGYISAKSLCRLNGQPITTLFPCANFADTTFYEMAEHALFSDSTEALPYRLESIWHSDIAVTGQDKLDLYEAFDVPKYPSNPLVVPDVYATITAAISAASTGDTIIVKDGYYTEGAFLYWQNQTIIGVGHCELTSSGPSYVVLCSSETEATLSGFDINGMNVSAFGLFATSVVNNKHVSNCYFRNTSNDVVRFISTTTNPHNFDFVKCVLDNQNEMEIYTSLNIQECYINNTQISVKAAIDSLEYQYNTAENTQLSTNCLASSNFSNNLIIRGNTFNGIISNYLIFCNGEPILRDNYILESNIFEFDSLLVSALSISGYSNTSISKNTFNIRSNTFSNVINVASFDTINVFDNKFYRYEGDMIPMTVTSSQDASIAIIKNNIDSSYSNTGYFIRVGGEAAGTNANKIKKTIITGNIGYGVKYFVPATTPTIHGLLFGFQSGDITISNNYFNGYGLNYVLKGSTNTYSDNLKIWANISANSYSYGFYAKGIDSVKFYNNTSYLDDYAYFFTENTGGDGAINCEVINSVIQTSEGGYAYLFDAASSGVFISSNNVIFSDNISFYNSTGYNWTNWQGLGYDLNSYNTDPLLDANLCIQSGSDALFTGINLGSPYDYGYNCTGDYVQQPKYWSMGSIIPDIPTPTLDTIAAGVDTQLKNWSAKVNLGIDEYNERVPASLNMLKNSRQHTYEDWSTLTNWFIKGFPAIEDDTINYVTDTLGLFRIKANAAIYLESITE